MKANRTPHFSIYYNSTSTPLSEAAARPYTDVILAFLIVKQTNPIQIIPSDKLTDSLLAQVGGLQAAGKTVRISFGGATISSTDYGALAGHEEAVADQIAAYVETHGLDGVDLDYEDTRALSKGGAYDGITFISNLTAALYKRLPGERRMITHAPQPPYLCAPGGVFNFMNNIPYAEVFQRVGHQIAWLNMQYYNNAPGTNQVKDILANYRQVAAGWSGFEGVPAGKLLYGAPVSTRMAGSGWFDLTTVVNEIITPLKSEYPNFGGVMGWQMAADPDGEWAEGIGQALGLPEDPARPFRPW